MRGGEVGCRARVAPRLAERRSREALVHVLARIVEAGKKLAESNLIGQVSILFALLTSIKVLICSRHRNVARLSSSRETPPECNLTKETGFFLSSQRSARV